LSAGLVAAGFASCAVAPNGTASANRPASVSGRSDLGQFHGAKLMLPVRLESSFEANTYSVDKIDES